MSDDNLVQAPSQNGSSGRCALLWRSLLSLSCREIHLEVCFRFKRDFHASPRTNAFLSNIVLNVPNGRKKFVECYSDDIPVRAFGLGFRYLVDLNADFRASPDHRRVGIGSFGVLEHERPRYIVRDLTPVCLADIGPDFSA
jgi:hypothetical protein